MISHLGVRHFWGLRASPPLSPFLCLPPFPDAEVLSPLTSKLRCILRADRKFEWVYQGYVFGHGGGGSMEQPLTEFSCETEGNATENVSIGYLGDASPVFKPGSYLLVRLPDGPTVCVCNLVFVIPLHAILLDHGSGSACRSNGGGLFVHDHILPQISITDPSRAL